MTTLLNDFSSKTTHICSHYLSGMKMAFTGLFGEESLEMRSLYFNEAISGKDKLQNIAKVTFGSKEFALRNEEFTKIVTHLLPTVLLFLIGKKTINYMLNDTHMKEDVNWCLNTDLKPIQELKDSINADYLSSVREIIFGQRELTSDGSRALDSQFTERLITFQSQVIEISSKIQSCKTLKDTFCTSSHLDQNCTPLKEHLNTFEAEINSLYCSDDKVSFCLSDAALPNKKIGLNSIQPFEPKLQTSFTEFKFVEKVKQKKIIWKILLEKAAMKEELKSLSPLEALKEYNKNPTLDFAVKTLLKFSFRSAIMKLKPGADSTQPTHIKIRRELFRIFHPDKNGYHHFSKFLEHGDQDFLNEDFDAQMAYLINKMYS